MQERSIFQVIALADVAMLVPAVMGLERNWLAPIYYLEVVLLAAIVAAAFVAVDHLSRLPPPELPMSWIKNGRLINAPEEVHP